VTWTKLQQQAMAEPSARAYQVQGEHFEDYVSPTNEDARLGLTVNR
jgi:hypothetical protein